jgi:CarD family transcriptional regulator
MLVGLQMEKPLSFREKKMLDRARHMLLTEIQISRALTQEQALDLLEKTLAKSALIMPAAL